MIDLHCHILPGLDDGPENLDEAVEMCRVALADGITTVVASPHYRPVRFEIAGSEIKTVLESLRRRLQQEHIPVSLVAAAEVSIVPELPVLVRERAYLTINGMGKYVLAEFPGDIVLPRWNEFLSPLNLAGSIPVLAHPERIRWFSSHVDELSKFVESGGIVQITAGSLLGMAGNEPMDLAIELLRRNIAHVIASDGHSAVQRPPKLSAAVRRAAEIVGEDRARAMVTTVPAAVIAGNRIVMPAPVAAEPTRTRSWMAKIAGMLSN